MMANKVLRKSFMPNHYLQLSQALKSHGAGEKITRLLSALNICMSDKQRWDHENVVATRKDEDLIPADRNIGVSAAFDNNDCDPHAKYLSAEHCSFIGATAHHPRLPLIPPATFGSKDLWMKTKDVTLDLLKRGRDRAGHKHSMERWSTLLASTVARSPGYLKTNGPGRSCLEAELVKELDHGGRDLVSQNLFVQSGSTTCEADNEKTLERMLQIFHAEGEKGRVVLIEGDEETYSFMVNAMASNLTRWRNIVPHPGGWHLMLHLTQALLVLYWGAGIESIAKLLGGDDKHAGAGKKHRRSHHFLTVTFEAMWCVIIEKYETEKGVDASREGEDVVSWLRERASNHVTLRFWLPFLLDHYPAYLGFRMGTRVRDYCLRTASLREAAPVFTLTQKL
ncbi:unnamed protein product [Sphacelaria rigidula]